MTNCTIAQFAQNRCLHRFCADCLRSGSPRPLSSGGIKHVILLCSFWTHFNKTGTAVLPMNVWTNHMPWMSVMETRIWNQPTEVIIRSSNYYATDACRISWSGCRCWCVDRSMRSCDGRSICTTSTATDWSRGPNYSTSSTPSTAWWESTRIRMSINSRPGITRTGYSTLVWHAVSTLNNIKRKNLSVKKWI